MYSRKPQTILTSRIANSMKAKTKKSVIVKEAEMTSPSEDRSNVAYINIGGVSMPISK